MANFVKYILTENPKGGRHLLLPQSKYAGTKLTKKE